MTATVRTSPGPAFSPERRRAPRIPVGIPVSVQHGALRAAGRVVDASETGLLIELSEPLLFVECDIVVALVLSHAGRHDVRATIIRRGLGRDGRVLLAVRLPASRPAPVQARSPRPAAPASPGPAPGGGAATSQRPRAVALAELRAVGTRAYELALVGPDDPAPEPLIDWTERLAEELGVPPAPRPCAARDLLGAISDLSRRARAAGPPAGGAAAGAPLSD